MYVLCFSVKSSLNNFFFKKIFFFLGGGGGEKELIEKHPNHVWITHVTLRVRWISLSSNDWKLSFDFKLVSLSSFFLRNKKTKISKICGSAYIIIFFLKKEQILSNKNLSCKFFYRGNVSGKWGNAKLKSNPCSAIKICNLNPFLRLLWIW